MIGSQQKRSFAFDRQNAVPLRSDVAGPTGPAEYDERSLFTDSRIAKEASPKMQNLRLLGIVITCGLVTASATLNAQQHASIGEQGQSVQWKELAPDNGKPFYSDPFASLTSEQLEDLSYVVRVRGLIAADKISADGVDAQEASRLASELEAQGIDIPWLMVQRERVRQMRGLQVERLANSIAESLQEQTVTLNGYVIPNKVVEGRLTEFFLVPTTAACSHEDAPPRLQVVFVSTEQGIEPPGRETPVLVTGKIIAETRTGSSINASGSVTIHSAYTMSSPEIRVFQATNRPNTTTSR